MEDEGRYTVGVKKGGELEDRVEWKLGGTVETLVRLHRLQISELTGVCAIKKGRDVLANYVVCIVGPYYSCDMKCSRMHRGRGDFITHHSPAGELFINECRQVVRMKS
jgi:hypothetical protein